MWEPELEALDRERLERLVLDRMRATLAQLLINPAHARRLGGARPEDIRPRAAKPPCVRGVDEKLSERGAHPIEDEALEALAVEGFELGLPHRERRRRGLRGREVAERTALPQTQHIRKGPEHHAQRLALLREPGDLGTGRERLRERGEVEVPGAGAAHALELLFEEPSAYAHALIGALPQRLGHQDVFAHRDGILQ